MSGTDIFARFLNGEIDMQQVKTELWEQYVAEARERVDPALFGSWRHSDLISSGSFSLTTEVTLTLEETGRFTRTSQSFGGGTYTDQYGNWAGTSSVNSGLSPGETGRWRAKDGFLTLEYDDDSTSSGDYMIDSGSLYFASKLYRRA